MYHVFPIDDWIEHKTEGTEPDGTGCQCEPTVLWIDPETGLAYPDGPVVVHNKVSESNGKGSEANG